MTFWIISAVLSIGVALLLGRAMLSGRRASETVSSPESFDMELYREQLREIDRDVARGTLAPDEAGRVRAEVSRRILALDNSLRKHGKAVMAGHGPAVIAWIGGILVILVAAAVYFMIGAPGYPDMGQQSRLEAAREALDHLPDQATAVKRGGGPVAVPDAHPSAELKSLMDKLRKVVAAHPDDIQGHRLLARNEASLGNFGAAATAQKQMIDLLGNKATADDYSDYADMLILAAGGIVSKDASDALRQALGKDSNNAAANYYTGLLMAQTGRPDVAFRIWDNLLRNGPQDAPWMSTIRNNITQLAYTIGLTHYQVPTAPDTKGPSADDVKAADQMSAADRKQMIQGMVDSLSQRIQSKGGTVQEWSRLITSLGVLGETDKAADAYAKANHVFGGDPDAMNQLAEAARKAGVTQ